MSLPDPYYQNKNITIYNSECLPILKTIAKNSIDSIVTDPPYGIGFMGKEWDTFKPDYINKKMSEDKRPHTEIASQRKSQAAGTYDLSLKAKNKYQNWCYGWAVECLRILKPGGFLLAFNSTRMCHRMICAVEDAGFEIRDMIAWVYGSGFPKSLNIEKAINKIDKVEFVEKPASGVGFMKPDSEDWHQTKNQLVQTGKSTERAIQWEGWGTALKPALEPITVARKPFKGTVAENVLKHSTGGMNIDGCRVGTDKITTNGRGKQDGNTPKVPQQEDFKGETHTGRFPSNLIHDGSEEVEEVFPETESGEHKENGSTIGKTGMFGNAYQGKILSANSGSASRFFYCAKASKEDRDAGLDDFEELQYSHDGRNKEIENAFQRNEPTAKNNHPTVKPTSLMQYLIRLVTPPGGISLDPFCGSGTSGKACVIEGFKFVGIDKIKHYCDITVARCGHAKKIRREKETGLTIPQQNSGQQFLFEDPQ